jgi:hypothetical protein
MTDTEAAADISVVVMIEGTKWVGQALEVDVATQGESVFDVIAELGFMFDTRDALAEEYANLVTPDPAPAEYRAPWRLCDWELST